MASSRRASQSLYASVSTAITSRYVCRTCRRRLLHPEASQIRQASNISSTRPIRRTLWTANEQHRSLSFSSVLSRSRTPTEPSLSEASAEIETYVEASTWDGLEHVGHEGHWRELPAEPHDQFTPWLDPNDATPLDRNGFLAYLYIAIIECLAYEKMNQNPNHVFTEGTPDLGGDMASLKIQLSNSGTISHLEDPHGILQQTDGESRPEESMQFSIPDIEEALTGVKFDFNNVLTFTILKRFSQLTGHRVPDPLLNNVMRTNKDMIAFVGLLTQSTKPKPKKFAEVLLEKQKKALDFESRAESSAGAEAEAQEPTPQPAKGYATNLESKGERDEIESTQKQRKTKQQRFQPLGPNVMIIPRKITEVDKEMEVGRWKVIERELKARGLPVLPQHAAEMTNL